LQTSTRVLALALAAGVAASLPAQGAGPATLAGVPLAPATPGRALVPFAVGERLTYDVKFGVLKAGTGYMEVVGIETVRGREAWHTVFHVRGGVPLYRVDDRLESWFDTRTLASLRHTQEIHEGRRDRRRTYEIFPERGIYTEPDRPERPTVRDPLDDGSFLYFFRTLPISVGQTYEFNRYFRPDRNPVTIRVLRRERVTVPAGTFNTIVIQPIIKSGGVFAENGQAQLWVTDDERRILVQMKTRLSIGSINLYLTSYQAGSPDVAAAPGTP
jgi:hypothetical protein